MSAIAIVALSGVSAGLLLVYTDSTVPSTVGGSAWEPSAEQIATTLSPGEKDSRVEEVLREPTDVVFVRRSEVDGSMSSAELAKWAREKGVTSVTLGPLDPEENPTIWEGARRRVVNARRELDELKGSIDPSNPADLKQEADLILRVTKAEAMLDSLEAGHYWTTPKGDGSNFLGNTENYIFVLQGGARIGDRWVDLIFGLSMERYPELRDARDYTSVVEAHARRMAAYEINSLSFEERVAIHEAFEARYTAGSELTASQQAILARWKSAGIRTHSFFDSAMILRLHN